MSLIATIAFSSLLLVQVIAAVSITVIDLQNKKLDFALAAYWGLLTITVVVFFQLSAHRQELHSIFYFLWGTILYFFAYMIFRIRRKNKEE